MHALKVIVIILLLMVQSDISLGEPGPQGRVVHLGAFDLKLGMTVDEVKALCPGCELLDFSKRQEGESRRMYYLVTNPEVKGKGACPPNCLNMLGPLHFDGKGRLESVDKTWGHWDADDSSRVGILLSSFYGLLKQIVGEGSHMAVITLDSWAAPEAQGKEIAIRFTGDAATTVRLSLTEIRTKDFRNEFVLLRETVGPVK